MSIFASLFRKTSTTTNAIGKRMKIFLNLLSVFAVPVIVGLLTSLSFRIILWSVSAPLDPHALMDAVAVTSVMSFIGNGIRVLTSLDS